ncbi:hypothetical protein [Thiobacter aerophilum]|uniref:Uncharacterized protein n=1 Tax=Thiobacter aerophilum TaxID=3121275 RepID=A0ABV0EHA9_9BURK
MMNWFNSYKSQALQNAKRRARARQQEQKQPVFEPPNREDIVVRELSLEDFLRLFPRQDSSV